MRFSSSVHIFAGTKHSTGVSPKYVIIGKLLNTCVCIHIKDLLQSSPLFFQESIKERAYFIVDLVTTFSCVICSG